MVMCALSKTQVDFFHENGYVIIENVLTQEEINEARSAFHKELLEHGVDHDNLEETAPNVNNLSSTQGAGGILDIFYSTWRFKVATHPLIFGYMSELWEVTYADKENPLYAHPYGDFSPEEGLMYINRVCYRIPDSYSPQGEANVEKKVKFKKIQRCLAPHIDICVNDMYEKNKDFPRWRPIQCITALTDNIEPSTGGFECMPKFHHEFDEYFHPSSSTSGLKTEKGWSCLGDFSPLRSKEDARLIKSLQHIPMKAGSVLFFDCRLPHANSYHHLGNIPREVVYTGFLPNVPINRTYIEEQLRRLKCGLLPADHWFKEKQDKPVVAQDYFETEVLPSLTPLGKQLLGISSISLM